jgi:hypothetical protein
MIRTSIAATVLLVTGTLFIAGAPAAAQDMCVVTNTTTAAPMVMKTVHFTFTGTMDIGCSIGAMANAACMTSGTYFASQMSSAMRNVTGTGTAPNPTCSFNCGFKPNLTSVTNVLCVVTMDSTDGLPVELMEFSVESTDSDEESETP